MKKFLTSAPLSAKLRTGEYAELSIFGYALTSQVTAKHKWYRSAGTTQTYSYAVTVTGGRMTTTVSTPGSENLSLTTKVEVWLEYDGAQVTEVRTFFPDLTTRKNPVRVGFINTLGGADYFTFIGSKSTEQQAERSTFTRPLPVGFVPSDRGMGVASVTALTETEIVSDFENESVMEWLGDLLTSPEVWIANGSSVTPIVITSKAQIIESDSLYQVKLKYRPANEKIVQNG